MNKTSQEKSYEQLSPFELKDKLIAMAEKRSEKLMLNAGRGNPNWVATNSRHGFFLLGNFAMEEAYTLISPYVWHFHQDYPHYKNQLLPFPHL